MSIRSMSIGSQLITLKYITTNKEARGVLEANDLLKPMLSRLEGTHKQLASSRDTPVKVEKEREKTLRSQLTRLDTQHDSKNRLLNSLLFLSEQNATSTEYKIKIETVRKELYPYGLSVNKMSYTDEAGESQRLGNQIQDASVQKTLQAISFENDEIKTTALEIAQDIAKIGSDMEEKLRELYGVDNGSTTAETLAKRRFGKVMTRLIALLEMELEDQPEKQAVVLKAYEEEKAKLRSNNAE